MFAWWSAFPRNLLILAFRGSNLSTWGDSAYPGADEENWIRHDLTRDGAMLNEGNLGVSGMNYQYQQQHGQQVKIFEILGLATALMAYYGVPSFLLYLWWDVLLHFPSGGGERRAGRLTIST